MLGVSFLGVVAAVVAWNAFVSQTRLLIAVGGFTIVIVTGTAMLFMQRVLDVGATRFSGTPLISRFDIFDNGARPLLHIDG